MSKIAFCGGKLSKMFLSGAFLLGFFGIAVNAQAAAALNLPKDANGWTVFTPSADSRIMYVSATGNDSTAKVYGASSFADPFKPAGEAAYATYAAAFAQARDGYPDYILFKRGETFLQLVGGSIRNGRSQTEPFVIGAYGTSGNSPIIKTGQGQQALNASTKKNFAVFGLDFYSYTRNPQDPGYIDSTNVEGVVFLSLWSNNDLENVLLEGCKFRFYTDGMNIQRWTGATMKNMEIRRCMVLDNYSGTSAHAQGIFFYGADLILEENIFDHNGWYSQAPSTLGEATIFNHNTYFSDAYDTVFSRNVFMRPSSIQNKFTANFDSARASTDVGNGSVGSINSTDLTQQGIYTLACIATSTNGGTFSVRAPDGSYLANATVGVAYSNPQITFTVTDGSVDFVLGDVYTIDTTLPLAQNITIDNNLYVDGEVGLSVGGNSSGPGRFGNMRISNNVLSNLAHSRPTNRNLGWGMEVIEWSGGEIRDNYIINQPTTANNNYGIAFTGSNKNVLVTGNIIYNLRYSQGIIISNTRAASCSGMVFSNNYIQIPQNSGQTIDCQYNPSGKWTFSNNKYFSDLPEGQRYRIAGVNQTLPQWQAASGDNSVFQQISFPDSKRDVNTYLDYVSGTSGHSVDDFIMAERAQDRFNWNPALQADVANSWIKAGFTASSPTSYPRADVDHNGSISSSDALLTLRKSLGLSMIGTAWYDSATTGDVDCNGTVTASDSLLILRKSLGLSMTGTSWCGS